jgi:hypothetical protein
MEILTFICGFFTGYLIHIVYLRAKKRDKKSPNLEKTYLRKGLYNNEYSVTQGGIVVKDIMVNFELGEIERSGTKSKVIVLNLKCNNSEYNNSYQKDKIKSMIEESWIDSKEIDWIEQDLSQIREEKINQILK